MCALCTGREKVKYVSNVYVQDSGKTNWVAYQGSTSQTNMAIKKPHTNDPVKCFLGLLRFLILFSSSVLYVNIKGQGSSACSQWIGPFVTVGVSSVNGALKILAFHKEGCNAACLIFMLCADM